MDYFYLSLMDVNYCQTGSSLFRCRFLYQSMDINIPRTIHNLPCKLRPLTVLFKDNHPNIEIEKQIRLALLISFQYVKFVFV